MSIPRTLIAGFIGLASCGDIVASDSEIIVAHRSRSAQGRVHFITTLFGARLPYSYYAAARAPAMRERAAAGNPGPGAWELPCGARGTRPGGLAGRGDHTGQQTGGLPQALWPAV